jgi:hypothetical protein
VDRSEEQLPDHAAWISGDFQNLGMRAFHATSSRSRWAIRLRIRLSGPIGELTASTDVEHLWRPGPISAVANVVAENPKRYLG